MTKPRVTLILAATALVGLALIAWFFVLAPRFSEASELREQADQVEVANLGLRNRYNNTRDLAEQAPQAAAEAETLASWMPRDVQLPEILEDISATAEEAGIGPGGVQAVNTTIPVPIGSAADFPPGVQLAQLTLSIAATDKAPAVLRFLDGLQNLKRKMLIQASQTTQAQSDGDNVQSLQTQGLMFVLQSDLPNLVEQVNALLAETDASAGTEG